MDIDQYISYVQNANGDVTHSIDGLTIGGISQINQIKDDSYEPTIPMNFDASKQQAGIQESDGSITNSLLSDTHSRPMGGRDTRSIKNETLPKSFDKANSAVKGAMSLIGSVQPQMAKP
jgi:hypothetical protein